MKVKQIWKTNNFAKAKHYPLSGQQFIIPFDLNYPGKKVITSYALLDGNTMFIVWENGMPQSKMILVNGGHAGTFSYNSTTNIITTCARDDNEKPWIVELKYEPNSIKMFNDTKELFPLDFYNRVSIDETNRYMILSNIYGAINILDIKKQYSLIFSTSLQKYGIEPNSNPVDNTTHTIQSVTFTFPYIFISAGNVNNKDERIIYVIDIKCENQNMAIILNKKDFNIPDIKGYHFETEGVFYSQQYCEVLIGINKTEAFLNKFNPKTHSELYSANIWDFLKAGKNI